MGCKEKQWTLSDGTITTTVDVSKRLGCSMSTAYARLNRTNNPDIIYKPMPKYRITDGHKEMVYTLRDGSNWTAREVAKEVGCKIGTASARLCTSTDPTRVLAKIKKEEPPSKSMQEIIKDRMYFDPLGHWKLLVNNT